MQPIDRLFAKVLETSKNDPAASDAYALAFGRIQGIMKNVEYAVKYEGAHFTTAIADELARIEREEKITKLLTPRG